MFTPRLCGPCSAKRRQLCDPTDRTCIYVATSRAFPSAAGPSTSSSGAVSQQHGTPLAPAPAPQQPGTPSGPVSKQYNLLPYNVNLDPAFGSDAEPGSLEDRVARRARVKVLGQNSEDELQAACAQARKTLAQQMLNPKEFEERYLIEWKRIVARILAKKRAEQARQSK